MSNDQYMYGYPIQSKAGIATNGVFGWYGCGGIWMVRRNSRGICERKILFRMKKEADHAGFKGTRTGPKIFSLKQNSIFYSTGINYPILLNEHMLILPCTKLNYRETNKQ